MIFLAVVLALSAPSNRAPALYPPAAAAAPASKRTKATPPPRPPSIEDELLDDVAGFQHDPLGYVLYAFPWSEPGTELEHRAGPYKWQREVLAEIGAKLRAGASRDAAVGYAGGVVREAVASGHGIGKSALVAWLVLWAISTMEDARGTVTANTEAQLVTKTWPEIQKWHRLAINGHWFEWTATALFSKQPGHHKTWRFDAATWSEHRQEAFAGLHNKGKRLLLIMDEASSIPDKVWEVSEGTLTDENTEIIWCAFGNPTRATGRFRECFRRFKHRWSTRNIDSRTVDGTNKVQIAQWVADYGENSDFVKVRVRGLFPSQSAKQFISEADVDAAYGRPLRIGEYSWAPKILSVDPAWEGDDELVIAMRQGLAFKILKVLPKNDNDVEIANLVAILQDEHGADAVFIDIGFGTGIYSVGKSLGRRWRLVNFAEKPNDPGCLNKRAEMWKHARDWMKEGGSIPADPQLRDDLLGPEIVARLDGKLQLESKPDMKARGLRSPNRGDALAISFAYPVAPVTSGAALEQLKQQHCVTDYDPLARG